MTKQVANFERSKKVPDMVSYVTVAGGSNEMVTLGFDSNENFALANQLVRQINAGIAAGRVVTSYDTDGTGPTIPAGASGALIQTSSNFVVLPYNYSIDLVTKPGPTAVLGSGAPNEMILSDVKTDLTFLANSGSGTVVAGGGDNRVSVGGAGDWSVNTGSGSDIIAALGGVNATISAGGGANAILLGDGTDLVTSISKDTVVGGSGDATIDASRAQSDFVRGDGSHLLFIGGLGGATIFGGSGSDTYLGSARQTDRQLVVGGTDGNNFLFAGHGEGTLVGGGNNDQLFAYGSQHQSLIAGSGNETLSAAFASGPDIIRAGSGNDVLIGGSGVDTFIGSSGSTTVTIGYGKEVFEFINHKAGGTELVRGVFDPSSIKIDLEGYGKGSIDQALAHQATTNGSVTVGLSDGTRITFQNVTSLDRSNFI